MRACLLVNVEGVQRDSNVEEDDHDSLLFTSSLLIALCYGCCIISLDGSVSIFAWVEMAEYTLAYMQVCVFQ